MAEALKNGERYRCPIEECGCEMEKEEAKEPIGEEYP